MTSSNLSSESLEDYGAAERAQAEQTISENELYADAKRFLDAKDNANARNLMEKAAELATIEMNELDDEFAANSLVYKGDLNRKTRLPQWALLARVNLHRISRRRRDVEQLLRFAVQRSVGLKGICVS